MSNLICLQWRDLTANVFCRAGGSLGQPEQTGITEPLELKVKRARTGLGRDEIIQQEQQEKVG